MINDLRKLYNLYSMNFLTMIKSSYSRTYIDFSDNNISIIKKLNPNFISF